MRKIRVSIDWGMAVLPDTVEYFDLPDGWDEMAEAERQAAKSELISDVLHERIGTAATVVETEDGTQS